MVQMLLPGFLERYADTMAPEHQELCRFLAAHMPAYVALRTGPRTASHGDFRLDNLLFQSGDPRPVVVDWQTLVWGSAATDVAYFVGGSVSTEDRRVHEADLVAHYHDALRRRGVQDYPLEQLRADARRETLRRAHHGHRRLHGRAADRTGRSHVPHHGHPARATRHRRRRARIAPRRAMTDLLVLCTGNAARSVMAGFMLDSLG